MFEDPLGTAVLIQPGMDNRDPPRHLHSLRYQPIFQFSTSTWLLFANGPQPKSRLYHPTATQRTTTAWRFASRRGDGMSSEAMSDPLMKQAPSKNGISKPNAFQSAPPRIGTTKAGTCITVTPVARLGRTSLGSATFFKYVFTPISQRRTKL